MRSPAPIVTGTDLRDRRLALGLSQARLAALADCSRERVTLWERTIAPQRPTPVLARIDAALRELEG
jgi:transcriptional regulator with XRE-family HTH domain